MKLQLENQLIDPRDEICDQLNSLLMAYSDRLGLLNKLDDYIMNSPMGNNNNNNDSGMAIYYHLRDQLDK